MWPFNRDKKRKQQPERSSAVPLSGRNTSDSGSPYFYPIYSGSSSDSSSTSSYDSGSSCDSGSSAGDSGGSCGGGD